MVCDRCKWVVKNEIENLGLSIKTITLGEVELFEAIDPPTKDSIKKRLEHFGFELIDDKKSRIIEQVKTLLIDLIHQKNADINSNLSEYITNAIPQDYSKLSNLFSEVEGISIEKYFIQLKIERVKELIMYDELSLSEIADLLHYSSVAHLSNQFKKVTGFSPTFFKNIKEAKRVQIDRVTEL